jgi:hypothetical protein
MNGERNVNSMRENLTKLLRDSMIWKEKLELWCKKKKKRWEIKLFARMLNIDTKRKKRAKCLTISRTLSKFSKKKKEVLRLICPLLEAWIIVDIIDLRDSSDFKTILYRKITINIIN